MLPDSRRQLQIRKTRGAARQALKFHGYFRRNDDLLKLFLKQTALINAAEVNEHRRVGDDDHLGNDSLRDWMSDASICRERLSGYRVN